MKQQLIPKHVPQWLITVWNVHTAPLEKQIYYMVADISMPLLMLILCLLLCYYRPSVKPSNRSQYSQWRENTAFHHFVRNNRLNLEHSTTFGLLFDKRHSSDYSDFAYCDPH